MIRPMRGQAVIREIDAKSVIWTPVDREVPIHRGIVLAIGAPALDGHAEVPWDLRVGDEVIYCWRHNEAGYTRTWEDGKPASWIPQRDISAVVEP